MQIVLAGRPNVGKSSLFNRLTNRRAALVSVTAGTTTDCLFETITDPEYSFILIDSPGHRLGDKDLVGRISQQAEKAWQKADLALLVCEQERHYEDDRIFAQLRHHGIPVLLLINKLDHQAGPAELAEFYHYGVPMIGVSAQSGLGIKKLSIMIKERITKTPVSIKKSVSIAILGCPNVGKSTLTNLLIGQQQQLVDKKAGTTRDSVTLSFSWRDQDYSLIDTAGLRRRPKIHAELEKMAVAQALRAARTADIIIAMIDSTATVTHQDIALLHLAERFGKGLVIALNKIDRINRRARKETCLSLQERLHSVNYANTHLISAAQNTGINPLMRSVYQAQQARGQRWKTPLLNNILQSCLAKQRPPRHSQPRYAHQIGTHPPKIIIHGKRMHLLPLPYKRSVRKYFSLALHLRGVPLQLQFKTDATP